jgi:hypothetical protein
MAVKIDTSGWPSRDELIKRHARGVRWWRIAKELGVTRTTIERYIKGGRPKISTYVEGRGRVDRRTAAIIAANVAFEAAMMKAIKAGRERAPIGVYIDPIPLGIRLSVPHSLFSCCGSSSAACLNPQWPR